MIVYEIKSNHKQPYKNHENNVTIMLSVIWSKLHRIIEG